MTIKELSKYLGKRALYYINGMSVNVIIVNVKQAFGRVDATITPVSGEGQTNVAIDGLRIQD